MNRKVVVAASVVFALIASSISIFFIWHGIKLIRNGDAKLTQMRTYFDERGHDPLGFQILQFFYIGRFFMGGLVGIIASIQIVVMSFTIDLAW